MKIVKPITHSMQYQTFERGGASFLCTSVLSCFSLEPSRGLLSELELATHSSDPSEAATAHQDRTTLGHALLNFGVGLDTALSDLLPMRLEQLESNATADPSPTSAANVRAR